MHPVFLILFSDFSLAPVRLDDIRVFKLTYQAALIAFNIFTAQSGLLCLFFIGKAFTFLLSRQRVYAVNFFLCQCYHLIMTL